MKKTINVQVETDAEKDRLSKWQSEDPESLNRVLQAGYNEGLSDGNLTGYAIGGLALLAAAGFCKIVTFIRRR